MKVVYLCFFFSWCSICAFGQSIEHYRWKKRIVLLFADHESDDKLQKQIGLLTDKPDEVTDRDLIMYQIFLEKGIQPDGSVMQREDARHFRQQYLVGDGDFVCLLIGKDGSAKMRTAEMIHPEVLFALIDQMPMRRSEMLRKKNH